MSGVSAVDLLKNVSDVGKTTRASSKNTQAFDSLFQSALDMVKETNNLTDAAEREEINYSLGLADNAHDLQIAQQKANIAIQYTVAVRNNVIDAYKEIMNLQF